MKHRPDVRFILDTDRDTYRDSYVTAKLTAVVITAEKHEVNNPGHFYLDDPDFKTNCLSDLTISGQASTATADDDGSYPHVEWYGWSTEYHQPYSVDLKRAQEMVSVLARVQRGLDKHEAEFGRPESFHAYAQLVARIVGSVSGNVFGIRSTPDRPDYDGSGFRWVNGDGLRYQLQDTATGKVKTTRRH